MRLRGGVYSLTIFLLAAGMLHAQAISGDALTKVPLSKMVFPAVFTTTEPTVAHIDGHNVLCYELYISNTSATPAELTRVEVLAAGNHAVLLNHSGTELAAALKHFAKEPPAVAGTIAPGEQVAYYAWVDLPAGVATPTAIEHALTLKQQGAQDELRIVTHPVKVKPATVTIQSPLRGANWVAANGPSNASAHRRTIIPLDGVSDVPQRFAIDWVQIDKSGNTHSGDEKKNESYYCYGLKIHAVSDGVVTAVKDGIPQNVPGADSRAVPITLETVAGNHIILDLGGGVYAFYAHLQPGSLRVKVGEHVKAGQVIALLGNSGNSTEPHLHFHLIDHNSPLGGEGLPFSYPEYQFQGKGSLDGKTLDWEASPKKVTGEIPDENEIVKFADETN